LHSQPRKERVMSRPEHNAPPDLFYNETEARKYASNSRMMEIQTALAHRAVELLNLPQDKVALLLDLGCGSGISGEALSEYGHIWIGLDISEHMLHVAQEREVDGDLLRWDLGTGLGFRPGVFDGAISVSALQWLCNSYTSTQNPIRRLKRFFSSLYACLARGARAVFQFYPETASQLEMITSCAMSSGFHGGIVIDYPNSSKAKKHFLCLFAGTSDYVLPQPLGMDVTDEESTTVPYLQRKRESKRRGKNKEREPIKSKNWVLKKKERQRKQGKKVRPDSQYTARPRSGRF